MHQKSSRGRSWLAAVGGVAVLLALTGCDEGSISDQNPYNHAAYVGGHAREIDELDLLGSPGGASEGEIQSALRGGGAGGVRAWPGSSLLVVQSGATAPDSIMLAAIEKSYRVFAFSGVAASDRHRDGSLGRDLRLAAARSGCTHVLCYWGKLESIREDAVTKTVSWVPIVGGLIPDEQRLTRLRVRAVLIDTASGHSVAFTPPAAENAALSSSLLRSESQDKQTYELKARAYAGLVAQLTGQAN